MASSALWRGPSTPIYSPGSVWLCSVQSNHDFCSQRALFSGRKVFHLLLLLLLRMRVGQPHPDLLYGVYAVVVVGCVYVEWGLSSSIPFMNKVISGEPESEHTGSAASRDHREGERTHSHPERRAWRADPSIRLLLQIFCTLGWCGRRPCNRYFLTWVLGRVKQRRGWITNSCLSVVLHVTFQIAWVLICLCFPIPAPPSLHVKTQN